MAVRIGQDLDELPSVSDDDEPANVSDSLPFKRLSLDDSSSSFPDDALGAAMTSDLGTQLEEFIKEASPLPSPVIPVPDSEAPPEMQLDNGGAHEEKFATTALEWRVLHIRERRRAIWEKRQEKLDKLKSKQQLMSKERLMQGAPTQVRGEPQESLFDTSVQESLSRAGGMRLRDLAETDDVDNEEATLPDDVYWTPEKGIHQRSKTRRAEHNQDKLARDPKNPDWRDKWLLYPTIALTFASMIGLIGMVVWHAVMYGWWWSATVKGVWMGVSAVLGLLLVTLIVLFYETSTQKRGPSATSLICAVGYCVTVPIVYFWPNLAFLPLISAILMGFMFKMFGPMLPLAALPIVMYGCVLLRPSLEKFAELLGIEARMLWVHLVEYYQSM